MTNVSESTLLDSLHQSIESLALEVALRDLGDAERMQPLLRMLAKVREEAASAGLTAVAELASGAPADEWALRDVVSRMQQMLNEKGQAASATPVPLNQEPELVADFVMESRDHLAAVEGQLLLLEQDPRNREAINTIFRGFHTIKGLAGFLDFSAIQHFAHEVETLLDLTRNSKLAVDSALVDVILASADHLKQALLEIESGAAAAASPALLLSRIRSMTGGASELEADLAQLAGRMAAPPVPRTAPAASGSAMSPKSVKVDTAKLDYLIEMVGELVIAQSQIRHDPDLMAIRTPRTARNMGQLTRITADVQRVAMTMRMIPVGQLFARMARLVRDLARKSGKEANLVLAGEETELDRNLVEELADPLMHMIRNAVDHGAEAPEARVAAGKAPAAQLHLKAWHRGGFINIEISDDGRGLARDRILARAQQRGLVSGGDHLSDQEIFSFIFEPGFSTAEKITDVSGRGVGMDVVRKQISKLRGRIDISSRPGHGTTFLIKLPLTMAVIEGLVVSVGDQRYIVPIFVVKEIFRPLPASLSTLPGGGEVVLVRGLLLPIVRLHQRFDVAPARTETSESILIVVEGVERSYCLQVDQLVGKQEVVIKNLEETFRHVTGIAGVAIMGDGRPGLILDVEALFGKPARG